MTNIVIPTAWLTTLLDDLLEQQNQPFGMVPYTNDVTPTDASVIGDFVTPGDFGQTFFDFWLASVLVGVQAKADVNSPTQCLNSGTVSYNVYGYLVADQNTDYLWAQRDPSAPVVVAPGGYYVFNAYLALKSTY